MKNTNGNVQDGLQHVLAKVNKAEFDTGKVGKFDMEFEGEGLPCNKCKFDVERVPTADDLVRLVEYKSYLDASKIQLPQFLNYIASVNNLSEMKYIFNAAKLSTEQAKEGMNLFLKTNAEDIFNVGFSKGLFKGIVLKDGTRIDIGTWQQLKGLCDNPEFSKSTLFDFITSN